MNYLIVTGMARSGTTLVDKLLHNHENVCIYSQPFPLIYSFVKQKFLKKYNFKYEYPLEHYFLKGKKHLNLFEEYLNGSRFKREKLIDVLKKMNGYSGQCTHQASNVKYHSMFSDSNFFELMDTMMQVLDKFCNKEDNRYIGSKETYLEEFLPCLLKDKKYKAIIIIRDIRDVINSLNFGSFKKYSGERRPILYDIRNWRKSIAFSLYLDSKFDNFIFIKYENIVKNPFRVLSKIASFLNINDFKKEWFKEGIKDQNGNIWKSNSSFSQNSFISSKSIGKHREKMTEDLLRYIETVCYPEMKYLGYNFETITEINYDEIKKFKDPFKIIRENFDSDYSYKNRYQEINRLKKLEEKNVKNVEKEKFYIFSEAYDLLSRSI